MLYVAVEGGRVGGPLVDVASPARAGRRHNLEMETVETMWDTSVQGIVLASIAHCMPSDFFGMCRRIMPIAGPREHSYPLAIC